MTRPPTTRTVAFACAAVALVTAGIAIFPILSENDMKPSALVRMTSVDKIAAVARQTDRGFVIHPTSHYDGIYMYAIARDPFALGREHTLIDLPGARYGHPLFGWLAGALSLGDPARIPLVMLVINLVGIAGAAAAASIVARRLGWTPWGGLVVAFNPGLIYAATVDTAEVLGAALFVLTLVAWLNKRWIAVGVGTLLLCFAKEPYVLVPLSLGVWELFRGRGENESLRDVVVRLIPLAWGPAAVLAWQLYLRRAFGYWAFTDSLEVFAFPFKGWFDTLRMAARAGGTSGFEATQIAAAVVPVLAVLLIALVAGMVAAVRLRSPLDVLFILLAGLHLCLTWRNLYYLKDLVRQFSTVFLLLPAVFAPHRAPAAPPDPPAPP